MAGVAMNSPMEQMVAMRMNQPQPTGVNQQMATGAGDPQMPPGGPQLPPQGPLDGMASAATGGGNMALLAALLPELQKLYPKLKLADHKNGHAELVGPTQEQFLGAAWAKHHGAKEHHVRNKGRGQRLHVSF